MTWMHKMICVCRVCMSFAKLTKFSLIIQVWSNSVDPDQTAPSGSGSTQFAILSASFGLIAVC